jgi:Ala-tRNA(Pro) deacylase
MTAQSPQTALVGLLERAHVTYELLPHRRTATAAAEARALDVDPWYVAKTLVLSAPDGFVRAVLPASERLDLQKVRRILGTKEVELATEEVLAGAYPEFELGAVPPIAPRGDRVLVDVHVCASEQVILEAGTHEQSVRLRTNDLIALAEAELVDICQE